MQMKYNDVLLKHRILYAITKPKVTLLNVL